MNNIDVSQDVIRKAAQGDLASFEMIYRQTSGFVYNVALRVSKRPEDAQEITQDVFLKIYRSLNDYRFESSLTTWIYRIAVNYSINYLRKRSKEFKKIDAFKNEPSKNILIEDFRDHLDGDEHKKTVAHLLDRLKDEEKVCMMLRHLKEMSYEQIADTLQININTVRTRLKRAREKLMAYAEKRGDLYEV